MDGVINIAVIEKSLKKGNKFTHKINEKIPIFPFTTREPERPKYKSGFGSIVGEFIRILTNTTSENNFNIEDMVDKICDKVSVQSIEDKKELRRIISSYLLDENNQLKVVVPSWFGLMPLSENNEQIGERKTGQFLFDVLLSKGSSVNLNDPNLINSIEDNVLTRLINTSIALDNRKEQHTSEYVPMLPMISNLFDKDFNWLINNPKLFIQHLDKLLYYYFFFYISQLALKLNQFTKADFDQITPVYYTLDWEKTSKRRNSYLYGWDMIKKAGEHILVHVNTLEQLNYVEGVQTPIHYVGLKDTVENVEAFVDSVNEWIRIYKTNFSGIISEQAWDSLQLNPDRSVDAAVQNLYNIILFQFKNNDIATVSRYQRWFEETVSLYLSKPRGQLGKMLNITQDFLMFLTVISLKNKKLSVNDLFGEFEKRGLFFDQFSKQEILELLDRLNLLEKKSDSGDAQYVKPIL
ncbi:MAG: DNA phosphorothioation-dependent restriction protein DptG [Bacillus sp. (in: firmicutes)]